MFMLTNIGYWKRILENPSPAYQELFQVQKDYLLKNIQSSDNVLDMGCGDGKDIETILQVTKNVTGIDNDPIAIEDAKNKLQGHPSIQLVCGDALNMQFKPSTFDVVVFLDFIENMGIHRSSVFKEAYRVLKPNGALIVTTYSEDAFDERMNMYEIVNVPIDHIEGTKFFFDKSVGAFESEQSSLEDLIKFGDEAGLLMVDHKKVGDLSYICKFIKA